MKLKYESKLRNHKVLHIDASLSSKMQHDIEMIAETIANIILKRANYSSEIITTKALKVHSACLT